MKNASANTLAFHSSLSTISLKNQIGMLALLAFSLCALAVSASAQMVLDDFTTGPYQKALKSGSDNNFQSGSMVGGNRETTFYVCPPGPCGTSNPFAQESSFQIHPKTKTAPAALVFSASYKNSPFLDLGYGFVTPLSLNLAPTYDRLRVVFDGMDQFLNFNILVWSGDGALYSQTGCNLTDPGYGTAFSVDFPFAYFTPGGDTPGADFGNITEIDLLFGNAEGSLGGEDFAVTSFQAIPTGAPAANVTCYGLGS